MNTETTTPLIDSLRLTYDTVEFRPTLDSAYSEEANSLESDAGGSCCCSCCCGTAEEAA